MIISIKFQIYIVAIGFNGWCNFGTNYTTNALLDFLDTHYIIEFAYMQVVGGSENNTKQQNYLEPLYSDCSENG